ncbi:protein phosphatase 1H-like [Physella acuta]|uniref:protein phosphatase 1H-like n=1 Tax=Physella acuta TaxID=109671 RepID=UPI0027DB27A2|nr:protein phosphatase 1H-like [Physella acuta]XP_059151018.1 protein phosphatase 1H-like [Physella acuta]XP_059151019.1 protein phosphatase 1H-like [Physella acuta]XP_059151020.1 protein phosphatase 1H-like [Physella acuta]XP_059151021.1 protein phosphatase 1H-like [Physella acuta]
MEIFSRFVGSMKIKSNSTKPSKHGGKRRSNPSIHNDETEDIFTSSEENKQPDRHNYSRPHFLNLSEQEEKASRDHNSRPIIVPNDSSRIPLQAGYAECINGGKSQNNEDQAAVGSFILSHHPNGLVDSTRKMDIIEVQYFAIFDGHAGVGAALMAADQLINHLQEKLAEIQEDLFNLHMKEATQFNPKEVGRTSSLVTLDSLVRGALEAAFMSFDEHIGVERKSFNISGGCAAIVTLILLGRVYVAHAGDCRAVAYVEEEVIELASEFTPETDAERIQYLAHICPSLTHDAFSENYFLTHPNKKDIGNKVLCRGPLRAGWFYKVVTEEDVYRPPIIAGQGKWARLMGVIGVARGFGDHGLVVSGSKIKVKPFLSPIPEVRVFNLMDYKFGEDDVIVMGCDGLWDMLKNDQVGSTLKSSLAKSREENITDKYRKAAEDLVLLARGDNTGKGWKMKDGKEASFDDISCFVIPLQRCLNKSLKCYAQ